MDQLLDPQTWQLWAGQAIEWIQLNVVSWRVLVQVLILVALAVVARILGPRLKAILERALARHRSRRGLGTVIDVALRPTRAIVFLICLWTVTGVVKQTAWPSYSYLLDIVASLATAWILISVTSGFVRNRVLAQVIAAVAWTVAALHITGFLDPTVAALEAMGMTFGELRISVLTVVKGVLLLVVLLWTASFLGHLTDSRLRRVPNLSPSVQVLFSKLLKIALVTLAVLIALASVGIDITTFAVFSGAVGVGIGFGLQKVVSNLISGVILLLDKSIKPGDVIELEGTFGWISSMGGRYVSVVTRDGKEILVPNEDLITNRVVNWSYSSQLVRMEIEFGVSYDADPHAVRALASEAAAKPDRVVREPAPVCHFAAFGDSSLDFLLRFWIRDPQGGVANVKSQVLLSLWDALKEAGIEIPFPHRDVLLREPVRVILQDPKDSPQTP